MIYDGLLDHNKFLEVLLKYCAIMVQKIEQGYYARKNVLFCDFSSLVNVG